MMPRQLKFLELLPLKQRRSRKAQQYPHQKEQSSYDPTLS